MERLTFGPRRTRLLPHSHSIESLPCQAQDTQGRTIGYLVEIFERDLVWKISESGDTFPPENITDGPVCYEIRPTWGRDGQRHGRILKATYAHTLQEANQIAEQLQEKANKNALARYAESTAYHVAKAHYSSAIDQAYAYDSLESAVEAYADNACQTMQSAGFPGEACLTAAQIVIATHRNACHQANHK